MDLLTRKLKKAATPLTNVVRIRERGRHRLIIPGVGRDTASAKSTSFVAMMPQLTQLQGLLKHAEADVCFTAQEPWPLFALRRTVSLPNHPLR